MKSEAYEVLVNGKETAVEQFEGMHWAHFVIPGESQIEIRVPRSIGRAKNFRHIYRYSILPARAGVASSSEASALTFKLAASARLVITVDDGPRLFLFADALEAAPPRLDDARLVNVKDYAPDNTGKVCQTEQIQKAINFLRKNGVLYFPPGIYQTGPLSLKSFMTLYLAQGAVLKSTADRAVYAAEQVPMGWLKQAFVRVDGVQEVTIAGHGAIDGTGTALRTDEICPHLLVVHDSKDVAIENVLLLDSAGWTAHTFKSTRVAYRNVKILDNRQVLNTDAFDIESSCDVTIEDSLAYCSDDAAVIKTSEGVAAENIAVRRNVFLTKKSALKVGTETAGAVTNVAFTDNDVLECDRGMTLACEDGYSISNVQFTGNRFEKCLPDARRRLIDFYTWDRKGGGRIENILIKDCTARVKWPRPSTFFPASGPIKGVRFENLVVAGKVCRNMKDADLLMDVLPNCDDRRANVHDVSFDPSDPEGWNPALIID